MRGGDVASIDRPHQHRGRRVRPVAGRDPHEAGRTATSLELLFDLVFVVAISQAADQLARLLARGHVLAAMGGFAFEILHAHRERAFKWSYASLPVFVAIAATGAGLHVAALVIGHQADIAPAAAVLALAVPVAVYLAGLHWLYGILGARVHRFLALPLVITAVVLMAAPLLAVLGVSMTACLLVVMVAPAVSVVSHEAWGHRHE